MDFTTTIIGAVLAVACVVPVIWFQRNKTKQKQKMRLKLTEIAAENNCQITDYEHSGNLILGIDKTKHTVFSVKVIQEQQETNYIDLLQIQSCKLIRKEKTVGPQMRIIEYVGLAFVPRNQKQETIDIAFYNAEISQQLTGELQMAEKWCDIINAHIKEKR